MPLFSNRSYINIKYSVTANMVESLRNKLTPVSLLLVNIRLALPDVGGPGVKKANEKRLILAHVIPRWLSAPITHGQVPVRPPKNETLRHAACHEERSFVTGNVRLHTALNEELSDSIDTDSWAKIYLNSGTTAAAAAGPPRRDASYSNMIFTQVLMKSK